MLSVKVPDLDVLVSRALWGFFGGGAASSKKDACCGISIAFSSFYGDVL